MEKVNTALITTYPRNWNKIRISIIPNTCDISYFLLTSFFRVISDVCLLQRHIFLLMCYHLGYRIFPLPPTFLCYRIVLCWFDLDYFFGVQGFHFVVFLFALIHSSHMSDPYQYCYHDSITCVF